MLQYSPEVKKSIEIKENDNKELEVLTMFEVKCIEGVEVGKVRSAFSLTVKK